MTRLRISGAALVAALAFALPAAAAAKTVTYGGSMFPEGRIALDVKVNKKKKPTKVVELRADGMKATCEVSQAEVEVWTQFRKLRIKVKKGGFKVTIVNAEFGNKSKLTGELKRKGKKIDGAFTYSDHFPADDSGLPEEDCKTETLLYSAKRGGDDVIVPPPGAKLRR